MTDFNINVKVDPSGAVRGSRRVREELRGIDGSANNTSRILTRLFAFVGIGEAIRRLSGLSDAFTSLENSIRVAVGANGDVAATLDDVAAIAIRTRTPVQQIAQLYQRGSIAARELGASQEELLQFTELVGQGLAAQGGSSAAAEGALTQLSQALGSGIVRAEEFNSILEGAFPIAQAAARGIDAAGGSVGRLRQLVVDGEISSREFFNALLSQSESLANAFALTTPTIGQAFEVLTTGLTRAAEGLGQVAGPLASFIRDVGLAVSVLAGIDAEEIVAPAQVSNIERLAGILQNLGRAAIAAGIALGVNFAVQGVRAAVAGVQALAVAIRANPLGAIATAVTLAVSALIAFGDQIRLTAGSTATALDFIIVAFQSLATFVQSSLGVVIDFFSQLSGAADSFDFLDFVNAIAVGIDAVIGLFNGLVVFLETAFFSGWRQALSVVAGFAIEAFNGIIDAARRLVNGLITQVNRLPRVSIPLIEDGFAEIANPFQENLRDLGNATGEAFAEGFEASRAQNFVASLAEKAEGRSADRLAAAASSAGSTAATAATGGSLPGLPQLTPLQNFLQDGAKNADTFFEGFLSGLDRLTIGLDSFSAEAGRIFGRTFEDINRGFADSLGQAIFQADSLGESLKSVARDAISQLVSSLVQLGLQFVANQALAIAGIGSATAANTAAAGTTAAAWAPAAAATSAATFGANIAPATLALGSIAALAAGLFAVQAFADGGAVRGPGGPRSDSILAALSNGEFVVNARATRQNRELLEDINAGRTPGSGMGSTVINFNVQAQDADSFRRSQPQIQADLAATLDRTRDRRT